MIHARDLIEECQILLGDPNGDYHTMDRMIIHMNRALRGISTRSQSIESWIFRSVTADEFRYGLTADFLRVNMVTFNSRNQGFRFLTPRTDSVVHGYSRSSYLDQGGDPVHYSIHGRSSIERLVASVDSASETDHYFDSDEITEATAFSFDRVINITDNSEAIIELVDGTRVFHSPLLGGTRPRFETGDNFRITSPNEPLQTLNITPVPQYTSDEGEEPLGVYYSRYHPTITLGLIQASNDLLEIDPELEPALLHYLCYWASVAEHESGSPQSQSFMGTYNSEYFSAIPKVRKRMRDNLNGWIRMARSRPRKANLTGAPDIGPHPFTGGVIN